MNNMQAITQLALHQNSKFVRENAAIVFAMVFGSICEHDQNQFSIFIQNLESLFQQSILGAIQILSEISKIELFELLEAEKYEALAGAVNNLLLQNHPIQTYENLFQFLANLLEYTDEENLISFTLVTKSLHSKIATILNEVDASYSIESILESLDIFFDYGAKLIQNEIPAYIQLFGEAVKLPKFDNGVKTMIRELILNFVYVCPNKLINDNDSIRILIHTVVDGLRPESIEISSNWASPQEYDENCIEDELKEGLGLVNRFIALFKAEYFLGIFSKHLESYLVSEDWRQTYAAIAALSQVAEHVDDIQEFIPIFHIIQNLSTSSNSMLQAACLLCIAQYCEDKKNVIQQQYCNEIVEMCFRGLESKIPRVRAYACAAFANFFDGAYTGLIKDLIPSILEKFLTLLSSDSLFVVKSLLPCLSSFSLAITFEISIHFEKIMDALQSLFTAHHQKSVKLSCKIVECLSICCFYTEAEVFKKHFPDIISTIKYFQGQILNLNDERIFFLLTAWKRILKKTKQEGGSLINEIYIVLKKVLEQVFEYNDAKLEWKSKQLIALGDNKEPYQIATNDVKAALELMIVMLKFMTFDHRQHIEHMLKASMICALEINDQKINTCGSECVKILLKGLLSDPERGLESKKIRTNFFFTLLSKGAAERNPENRMEFTREAQEVVEISKLDLFSTEHEFSLGIKAIGEFIEILLKNIKNIQNKMENNHLGMDMAEGEVLEDTSNFDLIALKYLSLILELITKLHPSLSDSFLDFLFNRVFKTAYKEKQIFQYIIFARHLLVSLFRGYGDRMLKVSSIQELTEIVFDMNVGYESEMITLSLEVFGEYCSTLGSFLSRDVVKKAISLINEKFTIANPLFSATELLRIKDTAIFALGQIISFTVSSIEFSELNLQLLTFWMNGLPLINIYRKNPHQILILISIIEKHPDLFMGSTEKESLLQKALLVFTRVYKSKFSDDECNHLIKGLVNRFNSMENTQRMLFAATINLTDEEKARVMMLLT